MNRLWFGTAASVCVVIGTASACAAQEVKLADCPAAVRKSLQVEAKGAKIESVTKEKDEDDQTVYWAEVTISGKTYAIGVLEDGTLTEMNLATKEKELNFDRCPAVVQARFRSESFGEKVGSVGTDMKYGRVIYEAVVTHLGKPYEIVIADDGTLVEKVLIINDEEIELT
jgi:hypothetical protein